MGALTDNRKRCLVDHRVPFAAPLFDLSPESVPPSKKPKTFPPPSPPPAVLTAPPDRQTPPPPLPPPLRRFPPAAPLTRSVHGPQRILKAFGLGSSSSCRSLSHLGSPDTKMGNPVSQFLQAKKADSSPLPRMEKGEASCGPGSSRSLGLEEYKQLVVDVQEGRSTVSKLQLPEVSEPPSVSNLKVVSREHEELSDLYILDHKVEDGGKVVLESTPVREERVSVKTSRPVYKELYKASSRKYDSILSGLDFELKLAWKKLSVFRIAREEQAKERREDLSEPFTTLSDEEEHVIDHALHGGSCSEILVIHKASNIEITREILRCLSYGAWLNDEVINVYLELLKERERRDPKRFLKCHFFNTFFYKKLISGKNGYDFKAVKRWTSQKKLGYGLIECDKIFVPIHKEVHWCLAVINVKDKKFQYLDSLGGMDTTVLGVLARYFLDEVKDKSDKQIDTMTWKQEAVDGLPLQKNGWDCGMFMLKYTDFYSRGSSLSFGQQHMEYFRKRTIKEILSLRAE